MHSATRRIKSAGDPNRGLLRNASELYMPAVNYATRLKKWRLLDHDDAVMEKEDAIENCQQDHSSVRFEFPEYEYGASDRWYKEKKS